jgi:cell division protein FtsI (penicillin-binding protein 3)
VREGASRDPFRPALELLRTERPEDRRARPAPARRAGGSGRAGTSGQAGAGRQGGAARQGGAGRQGGAIPRRRAGSPQSRSLRAKRAPTRSRPVRKPKRPPRLAEPARRLRAGTAIVLVLFTIIAGRLVMLQLVDARGYALTGLNDRLITQPLFAPRGTIYDRNHQVLAQSVEAKYVFADPSQITAKQVEPIANALLNLLGIPASELNQKLSRKTRADGSKDEFEYLARGVDISTANAVMALHLPGIGIGHDERSEAPGHDLAANLVGFASSDGGTGDSLTGRVGLEEGYNDLLSGTDGSHTFEVGQGSLDAAIPGGYDETKPAHPGGSLELTIDRDLQYEFQQVLTKEMSQYHADFGSAVAIDVHTGEVLAQASYPGYDADNPGASDAAQRLDANTQIAVDPGSIHKVITLGAALQSGAIQQDTTITLPGSSIVKGGTTYRDTTPLHPGTKITIPGILAYSSNVGAISVADKMSPQTLYDYQLKFGLGKSTHEGIPGESAGLVQPPSNWSGSSYGSIPIGDGVSTTPLQMAAVYATIANNGVYIQPHLIKATMSPDGKSQPAAAPQTHRVLSSQVAATLRHDLEAVVTAKGATGRKAAIPQYRVAGKTGTGELVRNGAYVSGDVASFIGMAPADNPQYVIAVFAHSATGGSSDLSAPTFQQMMSFTLQHYGVAPTGTAVPTFTLTQ